MSDAPGIVLCTLRYSDNLGDGVIGDSLAWMLGQVRPGWTVGHFDLAGRTGFAPRDAVALSPAKRLFYALPAPLRACAMRLAWPRLRRRVSAAWEAGARRPGYRMIVGGGQVVSDIALNFPLKFDLLSRRLAADAAPVAVYAVGVSSSFSAAGRRLFQDAFDRLDLRWFGARDADSLGHLRARFSLAPCSPRKTIDPAVWAADAYGVARAANARPRIGIGVAHPLELGAHASAPGAHGEDAAFAFLEALVRGLAARGLAPVLFNNGSAEDQLFTDKVAARLRAAGAAGFDMAARPRVPAELVSTIAGFDAIVAHRLHANIVAFSLGIPAVGMRWDRKVESFFAETGRGGYCIGSFADAGAALALVERALGGHRAAQDAARLAELKAFAMAELELLAQALDA